MASWKRSISSPFRKACKNFFHQQPSSSRKKKSQLQGDEKKRVMDLQGEVMACSYEDVQVMWSILDMSKSTKILSS